MALGACCVVAASLHGCTEFEDGDDVVETSILEAAPGGAGGSGGGGSAVSEPATDAPEWACIGDEPSAPPAALGNTTVTFTIFIADTVTRQPPPGLTVRACSPLDIECTSPMTADVVPETDGFVRVRVPQNFAGFFQITSSQTVPAMLYVDGAVAADVTAPPMLLIGAGPFQALSQSQGVAIDPMMGHLLLQAFDCSGSPASGMRFINDKGGQPFAFVDTLPVVGQTVTDTQGTAGFLNVLPGLAIVQTVHVSDGTVIKTETGRVRAGWFTYLVFGANP